MCIREGKEGGKIPKKLEGGRIQYLLRRKLPWLVGKNPGRQAKGCSFTLGFCSPCFPGSLHSWRLLKAIWAKVVKRVFVTQLSLEGHPTVLLLPFALCSPCLSQPPPACSCTARSATQLAFLCFWLSAAADCLAFYFLFFCFSDLRVCRSL